MATTWDYYDWDLKALKPTPRTKYVNGPVVDVVPVSSIVGKIYSYVTDPAGGVWWELYETYEPNRNMFVKHDPAGLFAVAPSGAVVKIEVPGFLTDLSQAASSGVVGDITSVLKWGLIAFVAFKAIQLFKK